MQDSAQNLFARAGFPLDQHRNIDLGGFLNSLTNFKHAVRLTEDHALGGQTGIRANGA
jgi:hypothetical protein